MNTINDVELSVMCAKIKKAAGKLNEYQREGKRKELWEALESCQYGALNALYRLNDLRFQKEKKDV